eukprot:12667299-Alexandrium_andersonii.AAC.1
MSQGQRAGCGRGATNFPSLAERTGGCSCARTCGCGTARQSGFACRTWTCGCPCPRAMSAVRRLELLL